MRDGLIDPGLGGDTGDHRNNRHMNSTTIPRESQGVLHQVSGTRLFQMNMTSLMRAGLNSPGQDTHTEGHPVSKDMRLESHSSAAPFFQMIQDTCLLMVSPGDPGLDKDTVCCQAGSHMSSQDMLPTHLENLHQATMVVQQIHCQISSDIIDPAAKSPASSAIIIWRKLREVHMSSAAQQFLVNKKDPQQVDLIGPVLGIGAFPAGGINTMPANQSGQHQAAA